MTRSSAADLLQHSVRSWLKLKYNAEKSCTARVGICLGRSLDNADEKKYTVQHMLWQVSLCLNQGIKRNVDA